MPGQISICTAWKATGRTRNRISIFRKLILQVEEIRELGTCGNIRGPETAWNRGTETRWRDARIEDRVHGE